MNWIHQEPEQEGTYQFSGTFLVTKGVQELLTQEEILAIYLLIKALVEEKGGIDYLQVFTHKEKGKLFFIDQLSKEMIESGRFKTEDNYCTLLLPSEY